MTPAETLRQSQVELRRWRDDDGDLVDRLVTESLDHLLPWMPWAAAHDRESAVAYLTRSGRQWEADEAYHYAITVGGAAVGSCALMRRIGPGGLEIGYWLHRDWTGRGLATMAASALSRAGLALPGTDHVEIHHDAANLASGAVARRLGFTEVGRRRETPTAPGELGITVVWRLRRESGPGGPGPAAAVPGR